MVKVSKGSVVQQLRVDRCHRCGGLMVPERVVEMHSDDWRCVSCGERVDPVILVHRQKNVARAESENVSVGHATSRLD